jgi:hypothetical protein
MKPRITSHPTQAVFVRVVSHHGLVRLELLPRCCRTTILKMDRSWAKEAEASAV